MLVLIVDDNELNCEIESKIIKRLGFDVITAQSGIEALRIFNEKKPDAILLDCKMPDMDGLEVTRRIRQIEDVNDLKRTPVIAVTGNDDPESRELCLKSGMDDFIPKPVDIDLVNKILKKNITIKSDYHVIDLKLLMSSADEDKDWAQELLDLFVSDTENRIKEVEQSMKDIPDKELIIRNFHTIKSSAASVGASVLSEQAKELESLSRDGNFELISSKIESFKKEMVKVSGFIEVWCRVSEE